MITANASSSVLDAIQNRRSVRSYAPLMIDRDSMLSLLRAATWAPTAMHEEPWAFAIIQDKGLLRGLSDRAKELLQEGAHHPERPAIKGSSSHFTDPDFNIFYDAGTLIVIYGKPLGPYVAADCWLAAENLMLAAWAKDLGTCVIGFAIPVLNEPEVKAELAISAELTAVVAIIVGTPRGEVPSTQRKEPQIVAWR